MPSGNILFPVDEAHEAGDCVVQCLAASKKDMHVDPRHAGGKQYRVPIRAKSLTTYLSGISVMVINGNRPAEVQRRAEKRPLPIPFGDLGVGASPETVRRSTSASAAGRYTAMRKKQRRSFRLFLTVRPAIAAAMSAA